MAEANSTVTYKDIPELPGYQVGDDGSVWKRVKAFSVNGRYLKVRIGGRYGRHHFVHRLILQAFVGARPDGTQACHNDGDSTNNNLVNLRWDTPTANAADRVLHGTQQRGERNGLAKLTEAAVRSIRAEYARGGITHQNLAVKYGVTTHTVTAAINRKTWRHVA